MGGGNSGADANRSEPPVPAETRQPRGQRPEHSHIPTRLPASVSLSDPSCGEHPRTQSPTARTELSSLPS